jgi:hypothetical protein
MNRLDLRVRRYQSRLFPGLPPLELVNRRGNVLHLCSIESALDLLLVTTLGGDAVVATLGSQQG